MPVNENIKYCTFTVRIIYVCMPCGKLCDEEVDVIIGGNQWVSFAVVRVLVYLGFWLCWHAFTDKDCFLQRSISRLYCPQAILVSSPLPLLSFAPRQQVHQCPPLCHNTAQLTVTTSASQFGHQSVFFKQLSKISDSKKKKKETAGHFLATQWNKWLKEEEEKKEMAGHFSDCRPVIKKMIFAIVDGHVAIFIQGNNHKL